MIKKYDSKQVLGPKALEMVMRDVLGGMEDLAIMKSYETDENIFTVESVDTLKNTYMDHEQEIQSNQATKTGQSSSAKIISFEKFRTKNSSDI